MILCVNWKHLICSGKWQGFIFTISEPRNYPTYPTYFRMDIGFLYTEKSRHFPCPYGVKAYDTWSFSSNVLYIYWLEFQHSGKFTFLYLWKMFVEGTFEVAPRSKYIFFAKIFCKFTLTFTSLLVLCIYTVERILTRNQNFFLSKLIIM